MKDTNDPNVNHVPGGSPGESHGTRGSVCGAREDNGGALVSSSGTLTDSSGVREGGGSARPEAFMEQALATWGGAVYRLALCLTRNSHDAEDITQDVFLRLLRDATPFCDDEHLKAWLLRTAINRCRELHRSAWRRHTSLDSEATERAANAQTSDDPESKALVNLSESPVWAAMGRLPKAWRLAVHLRYVEGCSVEEIAQATHCKAGTVRTRLHRARKQLKCELEALENSHREGTKTPRSDATGSVASL